jgi:hypothetical protein
VWTFSVAYAAAWGEVEDGGKDGKKKMMKVVSKRGRSRFKRE